MTASLKVEELYQFLKMEGVSHLEALPITASEIKEEFGVQTRTAGWIMYLRGSKHWNIDTEDHLIAIDKLLQDGKTLPKAEIVNTLLYPLTEDYRGREKSSQSG